MALTGHFSSSWTILTMKMKLLKYIEVYASPSLAIRRQSDEESSARLDSESPLPRKTRNNSSKKKPGKWAPHHWIRIRMQHDPSIRTCGCCDAGPQGKVTSASFAFMLPALSSVIADKHWVMRLCESYDSLTVTSFPTSPQHHLSGCGIHTSQS